MRSHRFTIVRNSVEELEDELSLWPNPADGLLTIRGAKGTSSINASNGEEVMEFVLRDVQGRELRHYNARLNASEFRIDVHALTSGGYVIEWQGALGLVRKMFIKP